MPNLIQSDLLLKATRTIQYILQSRHVYPNRNIEIFMDMRGINDMRAISFDYDERGSAQVEIRIPMEDFEKGAVQMWLASSLINKLEHLEGTIIELEGILAPIRYNAFPALDTEQVEFNSLSLRKDLLKGMGRIYKKYNFQRDDIAPPLFYPIDITSIDGVVYHTTLSKNDFGLVLDLLTKDQEVRLTISELRIVWDLPFDGITLHTETEEILYLPTKE